MRQLTRALSLALLAVMCGGYAFAYTIVNAPLNTPNSISGTVWDGSIGLPGTTVTAYTTTGAVSSSATTDANGKYTLLGGIADDTHYKIVPNKANYTFDPQDAGVDYPRYEVGKSTGPGNPIVTGCDFAVATRPSLVFGSQPGATALGQVLFPHPTVKLCQAVGGSVITDQPCTVTMGLQKSGYNGRVQVWDSSYGQYLSGTTQQTTSNGVATFDDLSVIGGGTGQYRLVASGDAASATSAPFNVTASLPSDVSGGVYAYSPDGQHVFPISNVTITATANGQSPQSVMTAADGTYKFSALPAGTYTIAASRMWYSITPASKTVTVPPSQTGVNFTNDGRIAGAGDKWINVTAPNRGEVWTVGDSDNIFWNTFGLTQGVKIELSRDGGATYEVLFASTPDDSAVSWTVTGPPTEHARIRITALEDGKVSDASDGDFTILAALDVTPPALTRPANVTAEQVSAAGTAVNLGMPTVVDDTDPNPVVTNDAPAVFPLGLTVVTWTATDASGNVATATQVVTIVDTTAPTLTVPADVTAEQTNRNGTPVNIGQATATDVCDASPGINNDAPAVLPLGTTTVTWTGTDASGNQATATQKVTIVDTTPPTLAVPADVTAEQTSRNGTSVNIGQATATDVCDVNPTITNDASEVFPLGTTTVTWTATDASGNKSTATQKVTVRDTTPPVIRGVTATPNSIWPVNKKMIPVTVTVSATDLCDAAPTAKIVGVTCNEAIAASDVQITGALTLSLRADRNGNGSGRVCTIKMSCTDASGNQSTATVAVTVPHDQGKK